MLEMCFELKKPKKSIYALITIPEIVHIICFPKLIVVLLELCLKFENLQKVGPVSGLTLN